MSAMRHCFPVGSCTTADNPARDCLQDVAGCAKHVEEQCGLPARALLADDGRGAVAQIEREKQIDDKNGDVPAEVVGDRHAEPWTSVSPDPSVEHGSPNRVLRQIPGNHDETGDERKPEDTLSYDRYRCATEDEAGQSPRDIGHADIGQSQKDRDVEELGAHQLQKGIAAKWKAGGDVDVFNAIADDRADGGEGENATQSVMARTINEREGHGRENIKAYDDDARNRVVGDFKDTRACVYSQDQAQGGGSCLTVRRGRRPAHLG